MKKRPRKEAHYGEKVWVNPTTEAMRKEQCFCLNCDNMKPGQPDHCATAQKLYEICVKGNIALMIIHCGPRINPSVSEKESLCFNCQKLKTKQADNCSFAQRLDEIYTKADINAVVTRCKSHKPKKQ